jgi:hypothetical protein
MKSLMAGTRWWASAALAVGLCGCGNNDITNTPNATPTAGATVVVGIHDGAGSPGGSVDVQVFLEHSGGIVVGVQTDITWDPSCLFVVVGSGETVACTANPALSPKDVFTKIHDPSTMRAVVFSMSDVEPIQQDTWLFSCSFTINPATTATQCAVRLLNTIVSDSHGGRVPVSTADGVVQVVPSP